MHPVTLWVVKTKGCTSQLGCEGIAVMPIPVIVLPFEFPLLQGIHIFLLNFLDGHHLSVAKFLEAHASQYLGLSACPPACLSVPVSFKVITRRRQSLYDVARLHMTAPMDFWQNSIPFFGAAAFCVTKIGNFIKLP